MRSFTKRTEQVMMELILSTAKYDERIRAVILNGSRVSPSASKDDFQDYDIIYIVKDVESFVKDPNWIQHFGDILMMQKPDEMDNLWPACKDKFTYLILFTDHNRIDLTLWQANKIDKLPKDSQSVLLLDKDNQFEKLDPPSDQDYLPTPPTEKEFADCCNEFFWVTTSVAKGICRQQLTYAKFMSEQVAKEELIKLLTWHVAIKTDFQKPIGKAAKYLQKYLEPDWWEKFCRTYTDADYGHMWAALLEMCELFNRVALKVSAHYGYSYNQREYKAVIGYLPSLVVSLTY